MIKEPITSAQTTTASDPAPHASAENHLTDDIVISVNNLGKMYPLYAKPHDRLKQSLWHALPKFLRRTTPQFYEPFWALHNISFEVKKGETVGIIGRNGSGKSTLLQIIAGTLTPTSGEVQIKGRVAALLELGSGFDPDFTGRENVFLNGAIWGFSQEQMRERFDDIAAFADIGQFIDQPVKMYSSGMFARLAFAVAINVDPDILIVDEILAVGDVQFQQRCVSRLREMKEGGLTLLFTSHSVDSLKSVCNGGVLLNEGKCLFVGTAEQATDIYLNMIRDDMNKKQKLNQELLAQPEGRTKEIKEGVRRYGTGHVQIKSVQLLDLDGQPRVAYQFGETIVLEVTFRCLIDVDNLSVSFFIRDITGIDLMGTLTFDEGIIIPPKRKGEEGRVRISFVNCLRAYSYGVTVSINRVMQRDYSDNILFDQIDAVTGFEVIADPNRPVHYKFDNPIEILLVE